MHNDQLQKSHKLSKETFAHRHTQSSQDVQNQLHYSSKTNISRSFNPSLLLTTGRVCNSYSHCFQTLTVLTVRPKSLVDLESFQDGLDSINTSSSETARQHPYSNLFSSATLGVKPVLTTGIQSCPFSQSVCDERIHPPPPGHRPTWLHRAEGSHLIRRKDLSKRRYWRISQQFWQTDSADVWVSQSDG